MTARRPTHLIVGEETAVRWRPTEARLVLIGTTGPTGRFDLTFLTVPAVDRVMTALADIRHSTPPPSPEPTPATLWLAVAGGEPRLSFAAPAGAAAPPDLAGHPMGDRQAAKACGRKSPVQPARPPSTPPPGACAMTRGCRRTGANGPTPGT